MLKSKFLSLKGRTLTKTKSTLPFFLAAVFLFGCEQLTWKEFSSSEGGFLVLMPGAPTEETNRINTESGPMNLHGFGLGQQDAEYMVAYADIPEVLVQELTPDDLFDRIRDASVASVKGELLNERDISYNEYPGRELEVQRRGGAEIVRHRLFLVGNRVYWVWVRATREKAFSRIVEKFLDPFRLL